MNRRQRRTWMLELLAHPQWEARLDELLTVPDEHVVAGLFGALLNPDPLVRWHAVTAFGLVVGAMAEANPESARVVMRRFLWSLNDESGGIGWGAPEAMAEIMAQSPRMANEYAKILRAYIHEAADGCPDCFLEYAPLRRGAFWGLGRLAEVRPEHVIAAAADIVPAINDPDPGIRGYAAWAAGNLRLAEATEALQSCLHDPTPLEIYRRRILSSTTVGILATEALAALGQQDGILYPQP